MFEIIDHILKGVEENRRRYEAMSRSERFWYDLRHEMHRAPLRSVLDTVHLHALKTAPDGGPDSRSEQDQAKRHEYWRHKFLACQGRHLVVPAEPRRGQAGGSQ